MNGIVNLEQYRLIGIDTNIFIYHFQQNLEFTSKTDQIFKALGQNKLKAITSIVALLELLSFKESKEILLELENLFNTTPNLSIYTVEYDIAIKAAEIRRTHGFRMPDSIQLATAVLKKADAFITND